LWARERAYHCVIACVIVQTCDLANRKSCMFGRRGTGVHETAPPVGAHLLTTLLQTLQHSATPYGDGRWASTHPTYSPAPPVPPGAVPRLTLTLTLLPQALTINSYPCSPHPLSCPRSPAPPAPPGAVPLLTLTLTLLPQGLTIYSYHRL